MVSGRKVTSCILVFSFLSFATIGSGLIIMAWLASESGSIQLVGQLFFLSSLASLLFSIYAGSIVDRNSRITVVRWGQLLRFLGVAVLATGTLVTGWLVASLFAYALLEALGTSLNAGALDGIFQTAVPKDGRVKIVIRVSIAQQLGLVAGTGVSGLLLHYFPAIAPTAMMLGFILLQIIIMEAVFSVYAHAPVVTERGLITFWHEGLRSIGSNTNLIISIAAIAILFSVSQMTNVLVPSFVRDTLQRGSDVYGFLETAWSAGGGAILVLAALSRKLPSNGGVEFIMLSVIGILMIAFALSRMIPLLVILYALLGALFSLSRAICNGRILTLARCEEIGRVRSATTMLTSLLGMLIYISPMVLGSDNTVQYYCIWGAIVISIGATMYLTTRKLGEFSN